jgi:hypothetical protein
VLSIVNIQKHYS